MSATINCRGFCSGGKQSPDGLIPTNLTTHFQGDNLFPKIKKIGDNYLCPLGFTQNPKTREGTERVVKNGGRLSICQQNPWKWISPKDKYAGNKRSQS